MRTAREDFFPSELYWLDRVGPVKALTQGHGGVRTDVTSLVKFGYPGAALHVMFDRLIEPDWTNTIRDLASVTILDARVTLNWPTAAGSSDWRGTPGPYMILNLYELLMELAINGAGLIRLYGYPHPRPKRLKFIPMPWSDVWVVGLLIERGGAPSLSCEGGLSIKDWP